MSDCVSGKCEVGCNQNRGGFRKRCGDCGLIVQDPAQPINQETLEDDVFHDSCPRCHEKLYLEPINVKRRGGYTLAEVS